MAVIHEIAIQAIKPEAADTYPAVRSAFLEALRAQPGVQHDATFESFFTMPEPDTTRVLVGITRWASRDAFDAASAALMSTEEARAVFASVDMKAFVQVRTADGEPFRLEDALSGPDPVLEVAIRRPKPEVSDAAYDAAHAAFFGQVRARDGFLFDREFVDDDGRRVVLIGWERKDAFMAALGALQHTPEMGAFFALIDVEAYQAAAPA